MSELRWHEKLLGGFRKTSDRLGENLTGLFSRAALDQQTLDDIEEALIASDLGPATARRIRDRLAGETFEKGLDETALRDIVADDKRAVAVVSKAHAMLKRRDTEFDVHSINDIVRDVALLLHSDAVLRHIQLRTALAEKIPVIRGDRVQLQQVVMNLLVNCVGDQVSNCQRLLKEFEGKAWRLFISV